MQMLKEYPDKSISESIMLAEHQRISNLYLYNASMAEKRVNIHLLLLGGGLGILGLPGLLGVVRTGGAPKALDRDLLLLVLVVTTFLVAEGVLTFRRVLDRRVKALEYLRAINRVNRFFVDRDPMLDKYLYWLPQDDMPAFTGKAHGVAELRDLVAILSSLYFGAFLADVTAFFVDPPSGWSVILPLGVGVATTLVAWLLHLRYERRFLATAELEASKNVTFPV